MFSPAFVILRGVVRSQGKEGKGSLVSIVLLSIHRFTDWADLSTESDRLTCWPVDLSRYIECLSDSPVCLVYPSVCLPVQSDADVYVDKMIYDGLRWVNLGQRSKVNGLWEGCKTKHQISNIT